MVAAFNIVGVRVNKYMWESDWNILMTRRELGRNINTADRCQTK